MSKGLKALKHLYERNSDHVKAICVNDIMTIEKELKALEIIRNYGYFDEQDDLIVHLPTNRKEEHNLLKEVLL